MSKFSFEKYLFNIALNSISVAKYKLGQEIKLVAERNGRRLNKSKALRFETTAEYEAWMNSQVSDHDAVYNQARALSGVLSAMGV